MTIATPFGLPLTIGLPGVDPDEFIEDDDDGEIASPFGLPLEVDFPGVDPDEFIEDDDDGEYE